MRRLAILFSAAALATNAQPAFAAATPADLAQQVSAAVGRCWNPPAKASGSVTVRFELNRDGTIVGMPHVTGLASPGVAESAVHAVQFCQPYRLPGSLFSIWQHTSVRLSLGADK